MKLEAITSRALLLACAARATQHPKQTTIRLTSMHTAKEKLIGLMTSVCVALAHLKESKEQLPKPGPWRLFLDQVIKKIMLTFPKHPSSSPLKLAGSLPFLR